MSLADHSHALKRGGLGMVIGTLVGELAVPVIYRVARHLPHRMRTAVHRYSPHKNKSVGVSAMTVGIFTGNPLMLGAGAGLVLSDAIKLAGQDRRMAKEWNRGIKGMPGISMTRYNLSEFLPDAWKYRQIGEILRALVTTDTWNNVRQCWIPGGREHPAIIITARKIIKEYGLDGHDRVAVLGAIQDWIQKNISYSYDSRFLDTFFHPSLTLLTTVGDCDCQSVLAASLGEALGVEMKLRLIGQDKDSPTRYNHIFSLGIVDGKEYPIETIFKGVPMGWVAPHVSEMTIDLD